MVTSSKIINFSFHFLVKVWHFISQFIVRKVFQLKKRLELHAGLNVEYVAKSLTNSRSPSAIHCWNFEGLFADAEATFCKTGWPPAICCNCFWSACPAGLSTSGTEFSALLGVSWLESEVLSFSFWSKWSRNSGRYFPEAVPCPRNESKLRRYKTDITFSRNNSYFAWCLQIRHH